MPLRHMYNTQKYNLCQILLLNMISLILNIVHQKLFNISGICMFSVWRTKAQHVLPEQKNNVSPAGKIYKFPLYN